MNQDSFIKELGRSYIVSSLIPAAFFCLIFIILFNKFIPINYFQHDETSFLAGIGWFLIISIIPIWLGFFLFSSVDFVVKLFEGHCFPTPLKNLLKYFLRKKLHKKAKSYYSIQEVLRKPLETRTEEDEEFYDLNRDAAFEQLLALEIETPLDDEDLMSTRLGNVLKASEIYSQDRYLIESINVWPRLFPLLPKQFISDMEEKNNHLMFLLNSVLLIYIAGILSLFTSLIGFCVQSYSSIQEQFFFHQEFISISHSQYLLISITLIIGGYSLYRLSVNAAQDFGLFFRAGFDLYRLELVKQLHHRLPSNRNDERNIWLDISDFFAVGEKLEWNPESINHPSYHYHQSNDEIDPDKNSDK